MGTADCSLRPWFPFNCLCFVCTVFACARSKSSHQLSSTTSSSTCIINLNGSMCSSEATFTSCTVHSQQHLKIIYNFHRLLCLSIRTRSLWASRFLSDAILTINQGLPLCWEASNIITKHMDYIHMPCHFLFHWDSNLKRNHPK